MPQGLVKYIVIIIVILIVVFLSQQAYSKGIGKTLISDATNKASAYLAKSSDWISANVFHKISGEVAKRSDLIKNTVGQEKQKVSENIGTKIENYFSGIANSIAGKSNNACPPALQTKTPAK